MSDYIENKSKKPLSQRNKKLIFKVLAIIGLVIVLSFSTIGGVIYKISCDAIQQEISASLESAGRSAADGVFKWLQGRIMLVRFLSEEVSATEDNQIIQATLSRKVMKEVFSATYYGIESDGSFLSTNTAPRPKGYDSRTRPWYEKALQANALILSDPYNDVATHKLVIGLAVPIRDGQNLRGVVGSDLPLDALQDFLSSFTLGGRGFVFLLDDTGKFLVHPDLTKVLQSSGIDPIRHKDDGTGDRIIQIYPIQGLNEAKWYVGVSADRAKVFASVQTLAKLLLGVMLISLLALLALLGLILVWLVARPVTLMTATMKTLSDGNLDVVVPCLERQDELGAMAEALEVFKQNAQEIKKLEAEQEETRQKNERNRRELMHRLADDVENSVSNVLRDVSKTGDALDMMIGRLNEDMGAARNNSNAVLENTQETSTSVQAVAAATEELSASIDEISRRVAQSAEIATRTHEGAESARHAIEKLEQQMENVGNIVNLINDVASQTNLLALNATIEAARAGEAGKGFAVVASEVKALSSQTAKATEDINAQISAAQGATRLVGVQIREIATIARESQEISSGIASTVEEQGIATREISGNVNRAAHGAQIMTSNISSISEIVSNAAGETTTTRATASDLVQQFGSLNEQIRLFLEKIRSS